MTAASYRDEVIAWTPPFRCVKIFEYRVGSPSGENNLFAPLLHAD